MATSTDRLPDPGAGRLTTELSLAGLALLVWGVVPELPAGSGPRFVACAALLTTASSAWLGWAISRGRHATPLALVALAVMAVAGGALAAFTPLALTFVGVAAIGATHRWPARPALAIAVAGPCATLCAVPAAHPRLGTLADAAASALAGAVLGLSRRQSIERATHAALVEVSAARADAERARAELLAGRNHLARELHDVLAHTLSALSLQLHALDSLIVGDGAVRPEVRVHLEGTKRLVREGLDEARGAVQALREDAPSLLEQLTRLAWERHAQIEVHGSQRHISPDVSLALYRVAQEALTNVIKHAPGVAPQVALGFGDDRVTLSVTNERGVLAGTSPLAPSGGGYGIQGIRERVLLIGGRVDAGPTPTGWRVEAEVPA